MPQPEKCPICEEQMVQVTDGRATRVVPAGRAAPTCSNPECPNNPRREPK